MERGEKIAIGVLAVAVIAAVAVFAYYQLPEDDGGCGDTVLTVTYQGDEWSYTLCDLKDMDGITGDGGWRTRKPRIEGPWQFTGVSLSTLFEEIQVPVGENASVTVTDTGDPDDPDDNYSLTLDSEMLKGNMTTYDDSGNVTNDTAAPIPMLAYRQDGEALDDEDQPLRMAFVVQEGDIYTSSRNWVSSVDLVDITTG